MFRKSFLKSLFVGLVLLTGATLAFAQTSPISGTVELTKADGTKEPVAGALVEVFRTDIKASSPPAKTNKRGEFNFAGLQLGWTFVISVSAPNCEPTTLPNIRAGMDKILISMRPGDGSRLAEDVVRSGAAAKPKSGAATETAELTAEQKKAQAEYEAKKAEIEAKNNKALKVNEIVGRALKEGNEAFTAKNFDLAVAKYDEGIAADPEFVGSAPIFHNNRGTALMSRAVETYNKTVKATDPTEKVNGLMSVKKDFADASDGYLKAWKILKNAPAAEIVDKANYENTKMGTVRGAKDVYKMSVRTEQVDPSVIESAKVLIPEYLSVETDPAKKAEASITFADLYRVVGDSENAIIAYKAILESSPDNADALVGAGLSLVNIGYINNDKTKLQEGANLLQKFAGIAPDTNKFKPDALALIETLKKEQNVTPQKVPATPKRRP